MGIWFTHHWREGEGGSVALVRMPTRRLIASSRTAGLSCGTRASMQHTYMQHIKAGCGPKVECERLGVTRRLGVALRAHMAVDTQYQ